MHCKEQISSHHVQWILTIRAVSVKHVKNRHWSWKNIYQASSALCWRNLNHAFPCLLSGAALLTSDPLWLCSLFQKILLWSDLGDYIIILSFSKDSFFFIYILEERTYLISKDYKLMSRWSLFISVAFRIPWVCSVQMCAYTGLCKHTLIHAPACFCGYDNTMDLPYPLFSSFHSNSTVRVQLLWFWNSYPGAQLSKLFCSELHFLGVGSKHLKEMQPKFWGFSF